MKTPSSGRRHAINGGKRSWRGKMATVLVSPAHYDPRYGHQLLGQRYSSSDRTHNRQLAAARSSQRYANGDKADAWTVGARHDANNIYLAAMYAETRNMTFYGNDSFGGNCQQTQNFEVVARSISSTTLIYRCVRRWPSSAVEG